MITKTLRTRTKTGWVTKPEANEPENALVAEEVDDNFLALEDRIDNLDITEVITPSLIADVTDPGNYWVATNNPSDKPTRRFSHLIVINHNGNIIQEMFDRSIEDERFWRSSDDGGTSWSKWHNAIDVDQKTTSNTDTTSGRVLQNGHFGLGGISPRPPNKNIDQAVRSGFYSGRSATHIDAEGGDNPFPNAGGAFAAIVHKTNAGGASDYVSQFAIENTTGSQNVKVRSSAGGGFGNWATLYNTQNLLGSVSQSGGTPTGAVIERGSNTDGQYTKYADGTLVCWLSNLSGNSDGATWTYPHSFADTPSVSANPITESFPRMCTVVVGNSSATVYTWADTGSSSSMPSTVIAIGRWF